MMQIKKESVKKQKRRIPWRDRFHRLKNKKEAVYRTPLFLRQTVGLGVISESGIFNFENRFNKLYGLKDENNSQLLQELIADLQQREVQYGILFDLKSKKKYMILHIVKKDMEEAIAWFSEFEKKFHIGLTTEERLGIYTDFLKDIFEKSCNCGSYILETDQWKDVSSMEGLQEKAFGIVAFRTFPEISSAFFELGHMKGVRNISINIMPVSDQVVADTIYAEYMGLDGVLQRLRRSNPPLYEILTRKEGEGTDKKYYTSFGIYFLMTAADKKELETHIKNFIDTAKMKGIAAEKIPFDRLRETGEVRRTLAMFGTLGTIQERYQSLLPAYMLQEWIGGGLSVKREVEETYDVLEMRELFFDEETEE